MSWASAVLDRAPSTTTSRRRLAHTPVLGRRGSNRPVFPPAQVDWARLVTIDFETYYDQDYTLRKLSTSQYVRDPRFEAQMMGLKIGERPTRIVHGKDIAKELARIDWSTHALLCHHTQFDGMILSHHYGVIPHFYYDTLSMARGWLANDIGAGLDELDKHFGGSGKVDNGEALVSMRGIRLKDMHPEVFRKGALYCIGDTEKCYTRFRENLLPEFPQSELDLIDATVQMFCCPTLRLDEKRARTEMEREIAHREALLDSVADPDFSPAGLDNEALRELTEAPAARGSRQEREAYYEELRSRISLKVARQYAARKTIGSSEKFADLLRAEGVDPPVKISPAWIKKDVADRSDEGKYTYAFAKDDLPMQELLYEHPSERVRDLCETRLAVKSSITVTRAGRLLEAGANGRPVPVYYKYAAAHTWRFGGGDGMNFQNFTRGGELRLSIMAPPGHVLCVADSSQIEARTNAWLWGQEDLLDAFRRGEDIYSLFASENIYGRTITKADKEERHVGKTAVLGLGFQMGPPKFRNTLARGVGGPAVFIEEGMARQIVNAYRRRFYKIVQGWQKCEQIIEDMAVGRRGEYKCLRWEKEAIWLPNGMRLKYPNLRRNRDGDWVYDRKGVAIKIYGGLLCENIVQALARIIVAADQLLKISERYPVVMTTHDEVVACVPRGRTDPESFALEKPEHHKALGRLRGPAAECMRLMHRIMTTPPAWCADIPLAAEGGWAGNYSK